MFEQIELRDIGVGDRLHLNQPAIVFFLEQMREAALQYHRMNPAGKISVVSSKPMPTQRDLAPACLPGVAAAKPVAAGVVRVLMPNRAQMELRASDLESVLPEGHRARIVWAYVERADLSRIYAGIKAVEGGSGRTPIAPEILFALWLYATVEGVSSARAIARLTQSHDAYRWMGGGVQVNYHTLSDFRVQHGEALQNLFVQVLGMLALEKLVEAGTLPSAPLKDFVAAVSVGIVEGERNLGQERY